MQAKEAGKAGLAGWREKVADAVAPPVSSRAPVDEDTIRAAIGALFFVLSVVYVAVKIKRIVDQES